MRVTAAIVTGGTRRVSRLVSMSFSLSFHSATAVLSVLFGPFHTFSFQVVVFFCKNYSKPRFNAGNI